MWDVEPDNNSPRRSAHAITTEVLSSVKPGSIIILHGMYDHNKTARDAIGPIIDGLKAGGYRFVTISELLGYR